MNANLDEMLERLGDNPSQIADTLAEQGIAGVKNDPCECAIARYVQTLGYSGVSVMKDVRGFAVETEDDFVRLGWDGPIPDFIGEFDDGRHPHLIAEFRP